LGMPWHSACAGAVHRPPCDWFAYSLHPPPPLLFPLLPPPPRARPAGTQLLGSLASVRCPTPLPGGSGGAQCCRASARPSAGPARGPAQGEGAAPQAAAARAAMGTGGLRSRSPTRRTAASVSLTSRRSSRRRAALRPGTKPPSEAYTPKAGTRRPARALGCHARSGRHRAGASAWTGRASSATLPSPCGTRSR